MIKKAQSDAATITAPTTVKTKRQAAAASSDDDFENKAPAKKKLVKVTLRPLLQDQHRVPEYCLAGCDNVNKFHPITSEFIVLFKHRDEMFRKN